MKKCFSTILSYLVFAFCGMGVVACADIGGIDGGTKSELNSLLSISTQLIVENADLKKKFDEGKLSSTEFRTAIDANVDLLFKANEHLQKVKDSGATGKQLLWGALGGGGGRTLLHGLVYLIALIPGWGPGASTVLRVLTLGGSGGANSKKE